MALLQDDERVDELVAEQAAAQPREGEIGERGDHVLAAAARAVIRFEAPKRDDDIGIDAIAPPDRAERVRPFRRERAALRDLSGRDGGGEIIADRALELRLLL